MRDRDGVSVAEAMRGVGLDPDRIDGGPAGPATRARVRRAAHRAGGGAGGDAIPIGVVDAHRRAPRPAGHPRGRARARRRDADARCAATRSPGRPRWRSRSSGSRAASPSGTTVATVGVVSVTPGAINVIPGEVETGHRHPRPRSGRPRARSIDALLAKLARGRGASRPGAGRSSTIARDEPAACSPRVVDGGARRPARSWACRTLDIDQRRLPRRDGARRAGADRDDLRPQRRRAQPPPDEYTAPEDLDRGVAVLAGTLARAGRVSARYDLLIRGGAALDGDEPLDVAIADGVIAAIGPTLERDAPRRRSTPPGWSCCRAGSTRTSTSTSPGPDRLGGLRHRLGRAGRRRDDDGRSRCR